MNRRQIIGSLTLLGLAAAGSAVAALSGPKPVAASAEGCCEPCPTPCCGTACDTACETDAQAEQPVVAPVNASATADPC